MHLLEDHEVDVAHSRKISKMRSGFTLSILRLEALALRHVDGGQHLVDRSFGIRADICQEGFLTVLGHGYLETTLLGDDISRRDTSHAAGGPGHATEPASPERVAPPGVVKVHLDMLVHTTEDVEPYYDVRVG